jgi:hypothetical protein
VPDLMYADDVDLLAWSAAHAQQLLDCLSLFCTLFDMEVNMDKTHAMVFRRPRTSRPATVLTYRGQALQYVESCTYLGLQLHDTKGFGTASEALARKGRKAMLGLLPLLRLHHISQGDLRLRLYDILVEPVISYGAHIWGPFMCPSWLTASYSNRACTADNVHFTFLRELYGAHRTASRDVLLRDTHRAGLPGRWLSLAASWWDKLAVMEPDRLAHQVWMADIGLMLRGCRHCWTFRLLEGLEKIGFITGDQWRVGTPGVTVASVKGLHITKDEVMQAVLRYQAAHWHEVAAAGSDPREGLSQGTHLRTHLAWVHPFQPDAVHDRDNAPSFLKLCLPRGVLKCLGRYRLGGHHLYGRLHGPEAQGRGRTCPLCSGRLRAEWCDVMTARCGGDRQEDLLHFVWECPAYDHIRDQYASVFEFQPGNSAQQCMQQVFGTAHQRQLARCIAGMDVYRRFLLGKGNLFGVRPALQPEGYVAIMPYPACLRSGCPPPGWLRSGPIPNTLRVVVGALLVAAVWILLCALAHKVLP